MGDEYGRRDGSARIVLPGGKTTQLPPRGSREKIVQVLPAQIIDAFVQEVGQTGFAHTRIDTVCRNAGISTREFYTHFPTKEACCLTAFDIGASIVLDEGERAFDDAEGEWEDRLQEALRAVLLLLADNPNFAKLCLAEILQVNRGGYEHLENYINQYRYAFVDDDIYDCSAGAISDMATGLIGGVFRLLVQYVHAGDFDQLVKLVPKMTYFIVLPIVGEERALRQLTKYQ